MVTVSQNAELSNPQWLFSFTHIFTKDKVSFVLPNTSSHQNRYDEFVFTEGQGVGEIAFPYEGQYLYTVSEQIAQIPTNTNPALAYNVVENGLALVIATSAETTNDYYVEFISSNEDNSNYLFAPDELNPPTPTPSVTATQTQTPFVTPTTSPTTTPTPSITASQTSTPTPSITASQTPSVTPTLTPSITASATNTPTPSITASQTSTPTPSITASQTMTPTPSITASATNTPTPSVTATQTQTQTQTNTPTTTTTLTSTPTQTQTMTPSRAASGTTEANAYLTAVVDAGGTGITSTVSAATRTLFTSIVSNGLWDKMLAFYPMLGGNSSGCKFNGRNPVDTNGAYRLVFNGGWTFNASGATSNGTNAWANTFLSGTTVAPHNNHMGVYMSRNTLSGATWIGCDVGGESKNWSIGGTVTPNYYLGWETFGFEPVLPPQPQGFNLTSTTASTFNALFKNGTRILNVIATSANTFASVSIGSGNNESGPNSFYPNQYSFATLGRGLSEPEVSALTTIINTFQTTLTRNTY